MNTHPELQNAPHAEAAPTHPKAGLAFVLGLLGCVVTVTAPVAWILGVQAQREIDSSDGAWSGRTLAVVGKWLGIAVTSLIAAALLFGIGLVVWAAASIFFAFS